MDYRIGFIGAGNMAYAIMKGVISNEIASPMRIYIYDVNTERTSQLEDELGVRSCDYLNEMMQKVDIAVLCVKPNVAQEVIAQISVPNKAILSIVAGADYEKLKRACQVPARFLRIMPNTPLMAGKGATVFAMPTALKEEELDFASHLFSVLGTVDMLPERLMSAVTGLSGSGPAYVYMFADALASAGVQQGLPYAVAHKLAVQTIIGSAQMIIDTGKHPAELSVNVCSPGGTTIDGVYELEANGFRSAVYKAVDAATKKADIL